jgi:hypothetical protein
MPTNKKSKQFVKGLPPKYKPDSRKPQYHGNPTLLLDTCQGNGSSGLTILFSLLLLSTCITPTLAQCPAPKGSYQDTCKVTGDTYKSTDENLKSIEMCKFDLHCKGLDGKVKHTPIYVQKSMSSCLKFFENCNGNPVMRGSNERICTSEEAIIRESKIKIEL